MLLSRTHDDRLRVVQFTHAVEHIRDLLLSGPGQARGAPS